MSTACSECNTCHAHLLRQDQHETGCPIEPARSTGI
jgi:hypothetical protein